MERNQTEKMWLIGAGLAAFVIALIGYFFFISPQRGDTASVQDQVTSVQSQNDALQQRITNLAVQNKNLVTYQQALAKARQALPDASGMPAFLHSLQSISYATSTTLTSLTVGDPVAQAGSTPAAAAPATSSTSTTAPAATPPAPTAQVYSMPISVQVSGAPAHLSEFMSQLQSGQPRAVLISQIAEGGPPGAAGSPASGATTLMLTMQVFVAPSTGAAPAATATTQPTAGG